MNESQSLTGPTGSCQTATRKDLYCEAVERGTCAVEQMGKLWCCGANSRAEEPELRRCGAENLRDCGPENLIIWDMTDIQDSVDPIFCTLFVSMVIFVLVFMTGLLVPVVVFLLLAWDRQ